MIEKLVFKVSKDGHKKTIKKKKKKKKYNYRDAVYYEGGAWIKLISKVI